MKILQDIENRPLETYEMFLLKYFMTIYDANKRTLKTGWLNYSDLLIDKFGIHAGTLFHLVNGLIEHPVSKDTRKVPFDLFSINALIRVLIETYITFNHIFVSVASEQEKHFRFLLWQLDGLLEQKKFDVTGKEFADADVLLLNNTKQIDCLFSEIRIHPFYAALLPEQREKIFKFDRRKVCWRFQISAEGIIIPLKIIELVKLACVSKIFSNVYKYTSIHTHSGFISIQHFESMRGKQVSDNYIRPLITQAIVLTTFVINDICSIDSNAKEALNRFTSEEKEVIKGINNSFKKIP